MASCNTSPVEVNEDVAIIILRHLADLWYNDRPDTHWMRIRGVCKAFNRAVLRYLSKTVSIGLENPEGCVEVYHCVEEGGNDSCTRTIFEDKSTAADYLKCIAKYVERPIAIDLKHYDHRAHDELIESLCSFRAIKSIKYGARMCDCCACQHLYDHAGPEVDLFESPPSLGSDLDYCGYDDGLTSPRFYFSEDFEDDYDDLNFREDDDY